MVKYQKKLSSGSPDSMSEVDLSSEDRHEICPVWVWGTMKI